jgi:superfamily II DNA or RNA helicase
MNYSEFLSTKATRTISIGFEPDKLNPMLFPFQHDIVSWALRKGRAAIFADCGLGKTPMQLEWARLVAEHTQGNVLILAPLSVSHQTIAEASKFGVLAMYCREQSAIRSAITITNYEMLPRFDPSKFSGIVLDESSILKSYDGKTRTAIIEAFSDTPFRLACTATPAPNDFMELGNHSEFVGAMSRSEMLSMFFVHDGGSTSDWRLKGHAERDFWQWICSWAVMIKKPSDLGYSDDGFTLPPLEIRHHTIEADHQTAVGMLFHMPALTLQERRSVRKGTIAERVEECRKLLGDGNEPWVLWCNLNAEGDALESSIPGAVQVSGSDSFEDKQSRLDGFADGSFRVLITKPSIAGFGMNWQHCANMAFVGLSDSYEQFYQAVRRCWRFGQERPVTAHVITSDLDIEVVKNIRRKEEDATKMSDEMVRNMADLSAKELHGDSPYTKPAEVLAVEGKGWRMVLGDCMDALATVPNESIDFSVFSPPFASLYTYSDSERDMGNCKTHSEFYEHFAYLVPHLLRVTKLGRLLSFHCMNLPTSKARDGVIGLTDFRGLLIKLFQDAGWIYHSEVVIWKDPVIAMQRTKALGLLYKQLRKDSAMSRQGIPDYLVTMRKPGVNPDPVTKTHEGFPVDRWQQYASPVWMDVNPSRTLQKESAREERDERHICPLQLDVIERAIDLWTNPGDVVLSPFAGIGSEGFVALERGRQFIGVELKRSYWEQAVANLKRAEHERDSQGSLFE